MFQPRRDAGEMAFVILARPPGDIGRVFSEMNHMLAGAAAGLQHVAGFTGEEFLQYRPDRPMVAVERRRIQSPIGFDRPAIPAKLRHILSHGGLIPYRRTMAATKVA